MTGSTIFLEMTDIELEFAVRRIVCLIIIVPRTATCIQRPYRGVVRPFILQFKKDLSQSV